MNNNEVIKIIDSVDLFVSNEKYLVASFMNTRKRKSFKINSYVINLLQKIDGEKSIGQIKEEMRAEFDVEPLDVEEVIQLLINAHIVTYKLKNNILDNDEIERYTRQINYFSEILGSELQGQKAQEKLFHAKVLIFGCGTIGGNIAVQLAMAGIRNMTLFDFDRVEASDVSRHLFYEINNIGMKKTDALKKYIESIDHKARIKIIDQYLHPKDDIEALIKDYDFVVNTLDEPYIGYTAAKISRICVKYNIPHFIAGGFDAHLASTGEIIIPHVSPCVECYANYFKVKLKNWKPIRSKKVHMYYKEIGGLSSMSLFSSSYACIEIIKVIADLIDYNEDNQVRGELLFDDLSLTYLDVKRDPKCLVCGDEKND